MKNVVLLTIDALRKDALGCYGNSSGLSPFIDSLQDRCIRFTREQSTGPYTQASFPGILTSSYYLDYGQPKGLSPRRTLISEPLKQVGIVTAAFHSNPYLCDYLGWNRGWDAFYDSMEEEVSEEIPYIKGDVINSKVAGWLVSHRGDNRPFFLWLHYMDIHEPYVPERKYIDLVDPSVDLGRDDMLRLFTDVLLKRNASDEGTVRLLRKLYDAHVREVDDYVKQFFGTLEEMGFLQDTAVIITSDHGDEFGEHGGLSHDDKLYSELLDTPLIIYDPAKSRGEVCQKLASNIDISPTIVRLFGLKPVANFQGRPLLPLADYPEKGCFGEAIDQRGQRGGDIEKDSYFYREQDIKLIYRANLDRWEMYDLKEDPAELTNIADKSPKAGELEEKLRPRVRRWLTK